MKSKAETGAALFETAINIALVMIVALAAVRELGLDVAEMFCVKGIPTFDANEPVELRTTFGRANNRCAYEENWETKYYW